MIRIVEKEQLHEGASFEDINGLDGFKLFKITGKNLDTVPIPVGRSGYGKIVIGKGNIPTECFNLIVNNEAAISIAIKEIKSIGMRGLNVVLVLKNGDAISFYR